ncbi:MAG TPA: triple tyrosine motif-containing protein, partial [Verrucomicrobium sp.]|nr:triple tyrosine motif-containing protein [Verrucomicrobium sp.]
LWGAVTGILFLLFSGPVAQGDANLWSFQNWKIEDGLPDNNVSGILQMPDGAILIATYGGLVRFDGVRMTQPEATPGNGNGRGSLVRTMLVSRSGQLWLATGQGRIVHRTGKRSEVFTPPHGANSFPVHLCEDAEGRIWVSYAEGEVVCIANGVAEPQGETQGLPGGAVAKFTVDRDGELWGVAGEALHRYQNGRFQKTADLTASPNWRRTTCIATAADGGLWLSSGLQIFQKDRDKPLIRVASIPEKADNTSVSRLFEDRSGTLWICLYDGNVYCLHEGRLSRAGGAMHEITAIADDQEGNIWLGASEGGLWRIRPRVLESLAGADPLVLEAMCSTAQDQAGDIWITGTNGFLYKRESGKWRHLSTNSGWTPAEARTVVANKKGGVWIGTKDEGVFESTAEGGFRPLPFPSAPPWGNIRAMLAAEDSSLWTAINTDLWHLEGNTWTLYSSNLTEGYIQTLTQDAEGVVWAGTSEGQLLAIVDGELRDCTPPGFGDAAVRGLLATPDGALWIGRATEGLLRITGPIDQRPQIVGPDQGLDRSSISHLILDDQGRLWGGSSQGIFSVSLHELTAAAAGASTRVQLAAYGRDEGLPSLQSARGYWPNTLRDQEGKLWFNMRTGTVLAHPGAAGNNPVPPPVQIQSARVDDKPVPVSDQTSLVLPPDHRSLDIAFAAMSFRSPQNVRIRHQLKGLETDWVESSRDRHVSYSRLPAGNYRFRVIAANDSGVWNQEGASLAITVRPFFWQTLW